MQEEQTILISILSIVALAGFFITFFVQKISNKIGNGALLDQDFDKPQAFHKDPIPRSGGLAATISFLFFIFIYFLIFEKILNDYLFFSIALFLIGFLDDIKFRSNPNVRLVLMIIILLLSIVFLSVNIDNMDVGFLKVLMQNRAFEIIFILLCFLFIINGANLVDGFNGLLTIHLILINFILLLININGGHTELSLILTAQIAIFFSFLLFNFPVAKIFLGDSGSYLFGTLLALNIIKTNNLNPEISSFFFCILLFYLFFEVFFSFFRKIYLKRSPLKPDRKHLHMLSYECLKKSGKFRDSNYLNSIIINLIYFSLILPAVFFQVNPLICRYWFFFLMIVYVIIYFRVYSFAKKQFDI